MGLAAPQIGVQRRIFTYDVGEGPHVIVNPEIVETSGEWVYNEGCLPVPGMHFEIVRPKVVTLRGIEVDGNDVVIEADEVLARLFQHEIDHLDGVLLLDRLEPDERKRALRAIREQDLATIRGAQARLSDRVATVRLVFLGTPVDAVAAARLVEAGHEVVLVLTQPDRRRSPEAATTRAR